MSAIETITKTLNNAPLYHMIEKMGMAVANAQTQLDINSINLLKNMTEEKIKIADREYSLIELGFIPSFYTFTEAKFDAKMEFSLASTDDISASVSVGASILIVSASINASYSRKFEQSAEGSSSISVKLVTLPPPEILLNLLKK